MSDTLRASYDRLRESSWYSGSGPVEEEPPAMPPAETDPEADRHVWQAVGGSVRPNIKGFDSLIQSCQCGEVRRVEVPW